MEFSLHRQLKDAYCSPSDETEVSIGNYRIDVVTENALVEIQSSSLAAIRRKVQHLLKTHAVTVVKPIIGRKWILKQDQRSGNLLSKRLSPKKGNPLSVFDELVYFTKIFPHPRLTIETPVVAVEELRYPGHGRRRWKRENDFRVEDLRLVSIDEAITLRETRDLVNLLPIEQLPPRFGTAELAEQLSIKRWIAQRIAYCLRETGAIEWVGKQGNALQYRLKSGRPTKSRRSRQTNGKTKRSTERKKNPARSSGI